MIERSSAAMLDMTAHTLFLNRKAGAETALRFLDAVDAALQRLDNFPISDGCAIFVKRD